MQETLPAILKDNTEQQTIKNMGWKASTIIINKPPQLDNEQLLKELGFDKLTKIEDEPFEVAINPDDKKVYIGTYKDNLLICAPDFPMQFFEKQESEIEKKLKKLFPNSEICSLVLHSAVNLWGYSITKDGRKIRTRAGSSDDGTFVDFGEPLEEEKDLLNKSTVNKEGKRTYILDNSDEEPMTEDQVGENFVFSISKRYFGEELDRADDLLFETTLTGYAFESSDNVSSRKIDKKLPSWAKYVFIILILIAWQIFKRTVLRD
jgi:hypothetical protein